jgi:hypothetical protein
MLMLDGRGNVATDPKPASADSQGELWALDDDDDIPF